MMIGLYMLTVVLAMAVALLCIESIARTRRVLPLRGAAKRIVDSPNLNLVLYEALVILITFDAHMLIEESQHPFLVEAFPVGWRAFLGFILVLGVLCINYIRFERGHTLERRAKRIYYVAASNAEEYDSPEQGLKEAIALVNRLSADCPNATERGLLEYLSVREDALGESARRRLSTL